jgi:hypothetical protein
VSSQEGGALPFANAPAAFYCQTGSVFVGQVQVLFVVFSLTRPAITLVYTHTAQLVAVCFETSRPPVGSPHCPEPAVPCIGQAAAASFAMVALYVAASGKSPEPILDIRMNCDSNGTLAFPALRMEEEGLIRP